MQQLQCMRSIVRICRGEPGIPNPCHHYVADRNINTLASKNLVISIPMPIQPDLGQHFLVGEDLRSLRVHAVVLQHLQAGRLSGWQARRWSAARMQAGRLRLDVGRRRVAAGSMMVGGPIAFTIFVDLPLTSYCLPVLWHCPDTVLRTFEPVLTPSSCM